MGYISTLVQIYIGYISQDIIRSGSLWFFEAKRKKAKGWNGFIRETAKFTTESLVTQQCDNRMQVASFTIASSTWTRNAAEKLGRHKKKYKLLSYRRTCRSLYGTTYDTCRSTPRLPRHRRLFLSLTLFFSFSTTSHITTAFFLLLSRSFASFGHPFFGQAGTRPEEARGWVI